LRTPSNAQTVPAAGKIPIALSDGKLNPGWIPGIVNVKTYGAAGDGTGDDTIAIQAAINYAIASGGGVLYFPAGTYNISVMLNAARVASINLSFIGEGATLKCISLAQIEAILRLERTTSPENYRFHDMVQGLIFDGNGKRAYYGIRVPFVTGFNPVTLSDLFIRDCHIGIDLQASMECIIRDTVLFDNHIGLRLRPVATSGGGNANSYRGIKLTNNDVGIMLYAPVDEYPVENNSFSDFLIQGTTIASILVAGVYVAGNTFGPGHIENTVPSGTATVDMGDFGAIRNITIDKADLVLYSSDVTVQDVNSIGTCVGKAHNLVEGIRSSQKPKLRIRGSAISAAYGVDFSELNIEGAALYNYLSHAHSGFSQPRAFRFSTIIDETIPRRTRDPKGSQTGARYVDAPATAIITADPVAGQIDAIIFDPSIGSWGGGGPINAIRYYYTDQLPTGSLAYASFIAKANHDTDLRFLITGDANVAGGVFHLAANMWTLVRISGIAWGAPIGIGLALFPISNDGPEVLLSRPHLQFALDEFEAGYLASTVASEFNESEIFCPNIPSVGTWTLGRIVYNSNPAAGGNLGWVCVSAGTPGIWKEFGPISM